MGVIRGGRRNADLPYGGINYMSNRRAIRVTHWSDRREVSVDFPVFNADGSVNPQKILDSVSVWYRTRRGFNDIQ